MQKADSLVHTLDCRLASILITELITFSRDLPFSSRACGQPGLTLELFIK